MNQTSFVQLNLPAGILRAVEEIGFTYATDIQAQSIPLIQAGYDVVGRSQTGTGKTAAFGIPAIAKVDTAQERRTVQVLLLCPTRELAVQACGEIKKLSKYTDGIKAVPVYGGAPIERQITALKQANLVVGTPGRVMDHLRRRTLKLDDLRMIILDEADEMLSMGFREDIETILQQVPEERQTILFSATMPPEIMKIIRNYQREPQIVEINKAQVTLDSIAQYYLDVPMGRKNDALSLLLHYEDPARAIIFCNTKKMVDELTASLNESGFRAEGLHGDLKQSQRDTVMNGYKSGRVRILVATDVAARGIDVDGVECVVNYDVPQNNEYYVHRIGRTGRAGRSGLAYTLCSGRRQVNQLMEIGRMVRSQIQPQEVPTPDRILERRRSQHMDALCASLEGKTIYPYMEMVDELAQRFEPRQIAAMALELLYGKEVLQLPSAEGFQKKRARRGNWVKLSIDVGREERMAPNYIVGAIAERTSLSGKDIGKIEIYDEHTIVEVPEDAVEEVLQAMEGCRINGHKTTTVRLPAQEGRSGGKEREERSAKEGRAPKNNGRPRRDGGKSGERSGRKPSRKGPRKQDKFASYRKGTSFRQPY